jgi:hypothetical protein
VRQFFVLLVIGGMTCDAAAFQAGTAAARPSAVRACSLLPKDLVIKVTTVNRQILDVMKPNEEPLGASGSSCTYAGITVQVDPFPPARLEELHKQTGKDWVATPGVGAEAYFRDNGGRYAELYARTGAHVFTIQMSVPEGSTTAKVKPNLMTLANEIASKLR